MTANSTEELKLGHELRLVLCIVLLTIVNWAAPPRHKEGRIILRGLGAILVGLKHVRKFRGPA